jgi:hypothetical protein
VVAMLLDILGSGYFYIFKHGYESTHLSIL